MCNSGVQILRTHSMHITYIMYTVAQMKLDRAAVVECDDVQHHQQYIQMKSIS